MSDTPGSSQNWKTPNEVLKLHRLKQKKKALQARVEKKENETDNKEKVIRTQKRNNPFAKNSSKPAKRVKIENVGQDSEDTLLELIKPPEQKPISQILEEKPVLVLKPFDPQSFANILNDQEDEETDIDEQKYSKQLPVDWSLKTRMRILSKTPLPGINLKASQEASGLTSFVRCIDPETSATSLDISPGARFHQSTLYWQHPNIPWMTLFPRNSKSNTGTQLGEKERTGLAKDWADSFHGLFQLLRARQCPFFYVCADSFTVLFRAAGIGGRVEIHALLTPTSRGLRNLLKQEEIEYVHPFKKEAQLNKSNEGSGSHTTSFEESEEVKLEPKENLDDGDDDDEDLEGEQWLESLGVDEKEIKKIHSAKIRSALNKEMADDFSDNSLVLIEGSECQAFFNFLLNAKSTTSSIGRLAGVPPTLLAPVAYPGATLKALTARPTKIRNEGDDYFSIELKGVILPHVLHNLCSLLSESRDTFSATLSTHTSTIALSKATSKLIEHSLGENSSDQVFGKENLSDCGIPAAVIDAMCKVSVNSTSLMERMCFSKDEGFAWS